MLLLVGSTMPSHSSITNDPSFIWLSADNVVLKEIGLYRAKDMLSFGIIYPVDCFEKMSITNSLLFKKATQLSQAIPERKYSSSFKGNIILDIAFLLL